MPLTATFLTILYEIANFCRIICATKDGPAHRWLAGEQGRAINRFSNAGGMQVIGSPLLSRLVILIFC